MRRTLYSLAALVVAANAAAGVSYEYETKVEAPRFSESSKGRVWVEGESYRAEVTRPDGSRLAMISRDADESATIIDFKKNTVTPRARVNGDVRSSALFLFPGGRGMLEGAPDVKYRRGATTTIAGESATEHIIEAKFRATTPDKLVGGTFTLRARIWTNEELPPLPIKRPLRSGYLRTDQLLDAAAKNVSGMVLRHELEVTRTLDGGPTQIETTSTVVTSVVRMQVAAEIFTPTIAQ
ncbi:MAG TPA: hypothetical protein VF911_01410 [Thermoanaerobaculia bacterium]